MLVVIALSTLKPYLPLCANGDHVPVGGMSDGSADQLYLSLCLAAIERYSEAGFPNGKINRVDSRSSKAEAPSRSTVFPTDLRAGR